MTKYKNIQDGTVINWDDSKGSLTKYWVPVAPEAPEPAEAPQETVEEVMESIVDVEDNEDIGDNVFNSYAEIMKKADKEKPAFRRVFNKDREEEEPVEYFFSSQGSWTKPPKQKEEVAQEEPQEIIWGA